MKIGLLFINAALFFAIAGIHIYWAFGGKWAVNAVIPTKIQNGQHAQEKMLFAPSVPATLIVASGLTAFGFIMLNAAGVSGVTLTVDYQIIILRVIAGIFLIRALGDFNYVGFFKRVTVTRFAENDTRFYSPLCLWLSLSSLYVSF